MQENGTCGWKGVDPRATGVCHPHLRHEPSLWVLLYHERVKPTNNAARRAARSWLI